MLNIYKCSNLRFVCEPINGYPGFCQKMTRTHIHLKKLVHIIIIFVILLLVIIVFSLRNFFTKAFQTFLRTNQP
jgi:cytochrome b561